MDEANLVLLKMFIEENWEMFQEFAVEHGYPQESAEEIMQELERPGARQVYRDMKG